MPEESMRLLADCLRERNFRLAVVMTGQLRAPERAWASLRANLLDHCEYRILVQCPPGDEASAKDLYRTSDVDGWDPPAKLPALVRWAWPIFGNSGRLAARTKPSFYFQMARQARAARVFREVLGSERTMVLKWRPDLVLLDPPRVPESQWEDHLLLPEFENHHGSNDQCALAPWNLMEPYLDRVVRLRAYFREGFLPHAERYLQWVLRGSKVGRMSICYAIDRGDRLNYVKASPALGDDVAPDTLHRLRSYGVDVRTDEKPDSPPGAIVRFCAVAWQRMVSVLIPWSV